MYILSETGSVPASWGYIADIIKDYDPTLELAWVPPENRELNEEYPFAVICKPDGGLQPYVVMRLKEDEVDYRVLSRLWDRDNKNGDVFAKLEAEDAARKAIMYKEKMERDEEAKEFAAWAIRSRAGTQHNGVRYE